ncbi:MAG TPA: NUDIX domain-containing protein [Egibacteraceae bacterium]|nr:NUDIX domain-containing protein [Egibacteraceae bacterium]
MASLPTPGPGRSDTRPVVAVGAVCVHDGRVLLIKRGRGAVRGRWTLPGGHLEHGELLADAALRELREETGVGGEVEGLCGIAERHYAGYHYVIVDYWVRVDRTEAAAADDAEDVVWATEDDLDSLDLVPLLREFLDQHGVVERMRATSGGS